MEVKPIDRFGIPCDGCSRLFARIEIESRDAKLSVCLVCAERIHVRLLEVL